MLYDLDEDARPAAAAAGRPWLDDRALRLAFLGVWAAVTLWKLLLATQTNVIWEEAHFVVAGAHPDLAYPDVPAGWPLFARLCTELFGWTPLAIRLPGLAVAAAIPFAIAWLAQPLVGNRQALWAGILACVLPPLAVSGTIFYPEGALQLLLALMLGAAVRAMGGQRLLWWTLTGVCGGLGLLVHYRFGLVGLGVVLFAILTRDGRALWRRPGFWLAGLVAAAGLAPALLYNVREGWPSLGFHAVGRHIWAVNPEGLFLHLGEQLAICTPAFFVGLIAAAVVAWRRWRQGDARAGLLLFAGATVFLAYTAVAPLYRTRLPHWPFLAYVALLPFVPAVLVGFVDAARSVAARRWRTALVASGPLIALAGALAVSAYHLAWTHADRVPAPLRGRLQTQMEDWRALEPALARAEARAQARFGEAPVLAASGHIAASRLEFPGRAGRQVFALDDPYDATTRFRLMRAAWGLDEPGLARAGRPVVIALSEPTYLYHTPAEVAFRTRLCRLFDGLERGETVELAPGRTAVALFTARARPAPALSMVQDCALFPRVYLARPERAEIVEDGANQYGAAADPAGVARVEVLLDGRAVGDARLGLDPPGGRISDALAFDPDWPRVQFDFRLPPLSAGAHRVGLRMTTRDGRVETGAERTVYAD